MRDKGKIVKEIEELHNRVKIYNKKSHVMGLDSKEKKTYNNLIGQYIKLKSILADVVYDEYIFMNILNGRARVVYIELNRLLGWHGELLVTEEDIEKVLLRYRRIKDKEELMHKIAHFYNLLKGNLEEYQKKINDEEFFTDISMLLTDGMADDFEIIREYLRKKFDVLYYLIDIEEAEEI